MADGGRGGGRPGRPGRHGGRRRARRVRARRRTGGAAIPPAAGFDDGPRPPVGNLRDTATQAEKSSYTRAYDLLARGESEAAVDAFDAFLRSFPDGPYSDNAWYWQGEAMYVQRRFDEARRNFGVVVNSFPRSTKVPDARLKIGFALYEQAGLRRGAAHPDGRAGRLPRALGGGAREKAAAGDGPRRSLRRPGRDAPRVSRRHALRYHRASPIPRERRVVSPAPVRRAIRPTGRGVSSVGRASDF